MSVLTKRDFIHLYFILFNFIHLIINRHISYSIKKTLVLFFSPSIFCLLGAFVSKKQCHWQTSELSLYRRFIVYFSILVKIGNTITCGWILKELIRCDNSYSVSPEYISQETYSWSQLIVKSNYPWTCTWQT